MTVRADHTKDLLDLNDDVLYLICVEMDLEYRLASQKATPNALPPRPLLDLGSTCKRLHDIAAPLLYRKLIHKEMRRLQPRDTSSFAAGARASCLYKKYVQSIAVDKNAISEIEEVESLLALLREVEKLRVLSLTADHGREHIAPAFRCWSFPKIDTLTISAATEDMLPSFPTLRALRIDPPNHYEDTIPCLPFISNHPHLLRNLCHLELGPKRLLWTAHVMQTLTRNLPSLTHLGTIHADGSSGTNDEDWTFKDCASSLADLAHLRSIASASIPFLGVQEVVDELEEDCEDRFADILLLSPCDAHREAAVLKVADLAFAACKTLLEVRIQRYGIVSCSRGDGGSVEGVRFEPGARRLTPFDD